MKEKVYITNSERLELLKDETQEKEVVHKYFEVDNSNAFNRQYKLTNHNSLGFEQISLKYINFINEVKV